MGVAECSTPNCELQFCSPIRVAESTALDSPSHHVYHLHTVLPAREVDPSLGVHVFIGISYIGMEHSHH